jgi:acyl transferase domain-containing protein
MPERVAFMATSLEQLAGKLQAHLNGEPDIEGIAQGHVRKDQDDMAFLTQDADLKETIVERWVAKRQLSKLAQLWARGLELDWNRLYGRHRPRRVALPTYPFAKERYWVESETDPSVEHPTASHREALHPLLHFNVSDLQTQAYCSTFTGEEFFLRDHRVRNDNGTIQKVLPGVACLEMARAALADALKQWPGSLELHDTVWMKPIVIPDRKSIFISLAARHNDRPAEEVDYRIYDTHDGQEIVHCRGRATFNTREPPARIDIARIKEAMSTGRLEADDIYAAFDRSGLHYGPAHRGITSLHRGNGQVLAQLRLPQILEDSGQAYLMHPSVMDSAVQALMGLTENLGHLPKKPFVPFALRYLRLLAGYSPNMVAWVRHSPDNRPGSDVSSVDIDLCDEEGRVCVVMRGFTGRVWSEERASATESTLEERVVSTPKFDSSFYQTMIDRIVSKEISVDEAIGL